MIKMKQAVSLVLSFVLIMLALSASMPTIFPYWMSWGMVGIGLAIIWGGFAPSFLALELILLRHNIKVPPFWNWKQTIEALDEKIIEKMRSVERVPLHLAETVRKQEYVDQQTNLGNRRFFDARLDVFLLPEQRTGEGLLILVALTGIDEWEQSEDNQVTTREELIQQSAILLGNALKAYPHAVLSKRGKSDFAIFIHPVPKNQNHKIADKLEQALNSLPISHSYLSDNFFHLGLVRVGTQATTRHDLLAKADLALRNAQLKGSRGWFELEDEEETMARGMVQWRTLFESTINQQKVRLWVQPIQYFQSHEILHSEIFARLVDMNGVDVSADEFIPMAMASGFMERIDRVIVDQVIKWMIYQDQAQHPVCVNLSTESLLSTQFIDWLIQRLSIKPSLIQNFIIEFAERPLAGSEESLIEVMLKLKNLGVRVGIDHVGEQLVTLDYLERLPIDFAKIHRSVINKIGRSQIQQEEIFIESLSQVAQTKGFQLLAEGIESAAQLERLVKDGVVGGQGYLLGTPIPLEKLRSV